MRVSDGVVYGDYFLLGKLAQGGMAEVFLAKGLLPEEQDKLFAVKRTLPHLSEQPNFISMFSDEARIASFLNHPNISRIYRQGEQGHQLYIVMEFIHGKDLRLLCRRARKRHETIPDRYAAFIAARVAEALDNAHQASDDLGKPLGVVHRDVSPQNIIVAYDGVPKLIDFGIAQAKDKLAQTAAGKVKGKFAYMSPEQARGQPLDGRSDLYSLGAVLYEMILGRQPFAADSDMAAMRKAADGAYAPIERDGEEIPTDLIRILRKALAKDPNERYARGVDLAQALDDFLSTCGHTVDDGSVSAYLRKLFREEYIRENAQVRLFLDVVPPSSAVERAIERQRQQAAMVDDDFGSTENTSVIHLDDLDIDDDTSVTGEALALAPDGAGDTDFEAATRHIPQQESVATESSSDGSEFEGNATKPMRLRAFEERQDTDVELDAVATEDVDDDVEVDVDFEGVSDTLVAPGATLQAKLPSVQRQQRQRPQSSSRAGHTPPVADTDGDFHVPSETTRRASQRPRANTGKSQEMMVQAAATGDAKGKSARRRLGATDILVLALSAIIGAIAVAGALYLMQRSG